MVFVRQLISSRPKKKKVWFSYDVLIFNCTNFALILSFHEIYEICMSIPGFKSMGNRSTNEPL